MVKANPPKPEGGDKRSAVYKNTVPLGDSVPKLRDMRAVHSKLTEGRHMGLSTDEGITRGELREELREELHAFEQRLDTRLDTRFKDINAALEKVHKTLD